MENTPPPCVRRGVRFEMNLPTDSINQFRKRLNQKALEDEERKPSTGRSLADWGTGTARNKSRFNCETEAFKR